MALLKATSFRPVTHVLGAEYQRNLIVKTDERSCDGIGSECVLFSSSPPLTSE